MHQIALLTATYNHPKELMKLFDSLEKQSDKNFTWVIINDGSEEETENVLQIINNNSIIDVKVINKGNGGKSSSINMGFDCLETNVEFVLIIDDDERLKPEAVMTVKEYVEKYRNSDCGVIHFNRTNEKGDIIANPIIREDFYMNFQVFKSERRYADGYLGYFVKALGKNRFTIYPGEKYIAPSTLIMKVNRKSKLLWAGTVLGETEYLVGGITKQGRKLRVKNPMGMIEYCELMMENGATFLTKLSYSTQGYAYRVIARGKAQKTEKAPNLIRVCALPGAILSLIWKCKYL
ncbi:MAG: glycosyltransferase family 2 protein [Clostridia bacterium]|nr:glycosyltransferase family 2 protein [Clostridia bacterium]